MKFYKAALYLYTYEAICMLNALSGSPLLFKKAHQELLVKRHVYKSCLFYISHVLSHELMLVITNYKF